MGDSRMGLCSFANRGHFFCLNISNGKRGSCLSNTCLDSLLLYWFESQQKVMRENTLLVHCEITSKAIYGRNSDVSRANLRDNEYVFSRGMSIGVSWCKLAGVATTSIWKKRQSNVTHSVYKISKNSWISRSLWRNLNKFACAVSLND
jgi:hypothetical protein